MGRPRLFVTALLLRFACACSYDPSEEPSLQPFLKLSAEPLSITRVRGDETKNQLDLRVIAEIRKKTYSCTQDTTAISCGGSQDPNDECYGTPPDFGPHWGEIAVERVTITKLTAEQCADDGTCTTLDAELEGEKNVNPDPGSTPYGYDTDHDWESTYRVVLPYEESGKCPRIHVEYYSETTGDGRATLDVDGSCKTYVAHLPEDLADAGRDAADGSR